MVKDLEIKKEQEIEKFIDWLHHFFSVSANQRNKLIKKVTKENEDFGNWLNSVRDFDLDMRYQLYNELRSANW